MYQRFGPLLLFIVLASVAAWTRLPAALAQGPGGQAPIFLPLTWRNAALADLATPRTAPVPSATPMAPTAAPTATPLLTVAPTEPPEPSPTQPPSETPPPTPTQTPAASGLIFGHLYVSATPAPIGLGADPGPALFLRRCRDGACQVVDRTAVMDETGRYEFQKPPAIGAGEYYQVTWQNEINEDTGVFGSDLWLGAWYGPRIVGYTGGEAVAGGDMELEDLILTAPSHGSGLGGLPWTFEWKARQVEVGTYKYSICDCCNFLAQRSKAWQTQSLGRATQWTMNQYPPNVKVGANFKYCWFITIVADKGATGESFHHRMHWFLPSQVAEQMSRLIAWTWGDRLLTPPSAPPAPRGKEKIRP